MITSSCDYLQQFIHINLPFLLSTVTRYSLDPRNEDMLLHPDKVMGPVLKGTLAKVSYIALTMIM